MECESLKGCPFFNDRMPIDRGLGQIQKKKYCEGDKTRCARYKVASSIGKQNVPLDLYPIMMEKANKIIEEYNRKKIK
jgi:hypothetical protein